MCVVGQLPIDRSPRYRSFIVVCLSLQMRHHRASKRDKDKGGEGWAIVRGLGFLIGGCFTLVWLNCNCSSTVATGGLLFHVVTTLSSMGPFDYHRMGIRAPGSRTALNSGSDFPFFFSGFRFQCWSVLLHIFPPFGIASPLFVYFDSKLGIKSIDFMHVSRT